MENERFSVTCLRCRQNLEFGDFTSSLCKEPLRYLLKSVLHVQHDYLLYTLIRIEIKIVSALEKPADWSYDFFH